MTTLRAIVFGAALLVASTVGALAHQLNVFAWIEDGTVVVEAKFTSGKAPVSGKVDVLGGDNVLLLELELEEDGTVRFPLDSVDATHGLSIEVDVGSGHADYWILTPEDIARQSGGEG